MREWDLISKMYSRALENFLFPFFISALLCGICQSDISVSFITFESLWFIGLPFSFFFLSGRKPVNWISLGQYKFFIMLSSQ